MIFTGTPGSGKGQVSGWAKEHGMAGDHAKLFEVHASKISHLSEVFQFLFPNGFFLNRASKEIVESILSELEKGSYSEPELDTGDLKELLQRHDEGSPPERIELIDEFLERESNYSLCHRLEEAREKQKEIQDRLEQVHKWGYTNPDMPDTFRKNYTESLNNSFSIKVFTPISRHMPTCEVPDFFEPFAVPADAFERYEELGAALQVIHPDRFQQYKDFYGRVVDIGDTSFQDLKNVDELNESDHYIKREFGDGESYVDTRVPNEKNIKEKFQRDWDGTFTEGVVCSSDFEYTLRGRLKEAMLSDDVDILCLYTGFLSDHTLRKFVMAYFMETMFDIVRNLSGKELKKLDRQFIASLIEAQEVVKISSKENSLNSADKVFNKYLWERMNDARHDNFNFWFDTKPGQTHRLLLSKTSRRVITQMNKEERESWYTGQKRRILKSAFESNDYKKLDGSYPEFGYGFIYDDEVVEWEDSYGLRKYGHRLPCPRMCVQDPVDMISNSDWSFFTEELDRWDSMSFQPFQEALFKEDWEKNAEAYIEESERKAQKEKEQEEQEEKNEAEVRKELACEKLQRKVEERGEVPSSFREIHDEILEELPDHLSDVTRKTIEGDTKELRKHLRENFDKGSAKDVDVEEVAGNLKTLERSGKPAFVYGARSNKDKQILAKRHILNNYEVNEKVAEDVAEEAASIAVMDLKMEGVIDENHHVQDEFEENPEYYRKVMDMNDEAQEDSEDVVDEDDESDEDSEDQDSDGRVLDDVEPPGVDWSCECGRLNEGDRIVCGSCSSSYKDVDAEFHDEE